MRFFIAVAEEDSVTNAAKRELYTAQPSLRCVQQVTRTRAWHVEILQVPMTHLCCCSPAAMFLVAALLLASLGEQPGRNISRQPMHRQRPHPVAGVLSLCGRETSPATSAPSYWLASCPGSRPTRQAWLARSRQRRSRLRSRPPIRAHRHGAGRVSRRDHVWPR